MGASDLTGSGGAPVYRTGEVEDLLVLGLLGALENNPNLPLPREAMELWQRFCLRTNISFETPTQQTLGRVEEYFEKYPPRGELWDAIASQAQQMARERPQASNTRQALALVGCASTRGSGLSEGKRMTTTLLCTLRSGKDF